MFVYPSVFYYERGLKIKVDQEILRYYLWHVYRGPYDTLGQFTPRYGAHISVILPLHGEEAMEQSKKYAGQAVDFEYRGGIIKGGRKVINGYPHINYWIKVECPRAEQIKNELRIKEENFLGFHLTISNNKARLKSI